MRVGVPKEIKNHEYRIGMTPSSVSLLVANGHDVMVEHDGGTEIGFDDEAYLKAGAKVGHVDEVFQHAEMIVKVKEPLANERKKIREDQIIFTYLHLAPDLEQTEDLMKSGATCIAYETVTSSDGSLPLLVPMSEIAGRMSIQEGALCLEKSKKGLGVLLSGVPGVEPGKVTILGGGIVGYNAAVIAVGMGAEVTVIDLSPKVLKKLETIFGSRIKTIYSNQDNIEKYVLSSDLVVGGVLVPGASAPKLVSREMVSKMKKGSVIVDVAIDQGGCFETSRPTTHDEPTFIVDGVVHYCVANMPGAVARTSTLALNSVTLPYVLKLANLGYEKALQEDENFRNGLNVYQGKVTCKEVATSLGLTFHSPMDLLKG